jgi:hypothetical protein
VNGRELTEALGVNRDFIYKWVKRGWLRPKRVGAGYWSGEELYFDDEEQRVARQMLSLVRAGMYPDGAHKIARGGVAALDKLLKAAAPSPAVAQLHWQLARDGVRREGSAPGRSRAVDALAAPEDSVLF